MTRVVAFVFALILPVVLFAQSWPVHENPYVNDYADIVEQGAEARLTTALKNLREQTGIEATVLTLYTREGYTNGSLEGFATGLFNHWGVGDAARDDGILVLVVSQDREMRIALGDAYGTAFNREAQDIIDRVFLPAFRDGAFSTGIEDGTAAVIDRIAQVHYADDAPAPAGGTGGGATSPFIAVVFALIAALAVFGRRISNWFRPCPQCGARGLHTDRNTVTSATTASRGMGEQTVVCARCGYSNTNTYTIPRRTRSSPSNSFGGGSSSGGGASGRW